MGCHNLSYIASRSFFYNNGMRVTLLRVFEDFMEMNVTSQVRLVPVNLENLFVL
jgi:hypothetical protein